MASEDGSLWLVFNGEVYNFLELRRELQDYGFTFRSTSDTEVILYAYQKWGLEAFRRFNGMFALALWDGYLGRLVLARDRMGVKPLYFARTGEALFFGSELKQFLGLPGLDRRPNPAVIRDFLVQGVLDHTAATLLDGVS
jgi:asparagine synthase (glutamine-hydrolysing)